MQHYTLNSVSDQYRAPKPGRMWMPNKHVIASEPKLHQLKNNSNFDKPVL